MGVRKEEAGIPSGKWRHGGECLRGLHGVRHFAVVELEEVAWNTNSYGQRIRGSQLRFWRKRCC